MGRVFSEADGRPGEEPRRVVVLTHHYWQSHFGGRADVLGQTLLLNREPYEVIGVLHPDAFREGQGGGTDVVVPLHTRLDPSYVYGIFGRLKPGMDVRTAEAGLQPMFQQFARDTPHLYPKDFRVELQTFTQVRRSSGAVPIIVLIFAAAVLLLILACVNVSILLLARGAARVQEFAVRAALGASRRRLMGQLLVESLLLACAGAALGLMAGYWGVPAIVRWVPRNAFPSLSQDVQTSLPVLLFSAGIAFLSGLLFGLSPALSFSRAGAATGVEARTRATEGRRSRRLHHVLLGGQVALTVLLLAGTGAAVRALAGLYQAPLGYDPHHLGAVFVNLPEQSHGTWADRTDFYERLRSRLSRTPQVESAALGVYTGLPPRTGGLTRIEIPGTDTTQNSLAVVQRIAPQYFATLRIPFVEGSVWSETDSARAAHVAVINQTMARQLWPGENPLGRRLRAPEFARSTSQFILPAPGLDGSFEVVGVVRDTPNRGLHEPPAAAIFVPYTLLVGDAVMFVVRTTRDPLTMTAALRQAVQDVDPNQPVNQVRTGEEVLAQAGWARERFVTLLLSAFAGFALVLAAVGLYSVVSYAVSRRVREFGIRSALGADSVTIIGIAVRSTLLSILVGVISGLALSVISDTVVAQWSIGRLSDPWVLGAITLIFGMVAVLAAAIPARRPAGIARAVALRVE